VLATTQFHGEVKATLAMSAESGRQARGG